MSPIARLYTQEAMEAVRAFDLECAIGERDNTEHHALTAAADKVDTALGKWFRERYAREYQHQSQPVVLAAVRKGVRFTAREYLEDCRSYNLAEYLEDHPDYFLQ